VMAADTQIAPALRDDMPNWDNFYMLVGSTAGTLIGLIFVVISLGAEHAKSCDEDRTRIFVTPVLFHFASLLLIALAISAPVSNVLRAGVLGAIGCAGLAYVANLALLAKKRIKASEREVIWDSVLPLLGYVCILVSAAAWALGASFADDIGAIASVVLLVTALRNSWAITLARIAARFQVAKKAARCGFPEAGALTLTGRNRSRRAS
jgi:lipid-A-disaccharide synthase-like uncharacterized protein